MPHHNETQGVRSHEIVLHCETLWKIIHKDLKEIGPVRDRII